MKKIDPKKVLEKWKPLLKGTPLEKGLPDGERLTEGMLPICVNLLNTIGDKEIVATSEVVPIPVTYKGEIVGIGIRGQVEFFDTPEAKEAIAYISDMDGKIGISSRKRGTIGPDGSITESKSIEHDIIKHDKEEE